MASQHAIYRFGPYELRTRTRELFKHGIRLKLRPQPFQVLHALVERGGDLVTREELRKELWPSNTFVDFEHGLNNSIKELRGVLGESTDKPRYIETLPKLGYRIVIPVEVERAASLRAVAPGIAKQVKVTEGKGAGHDPENAARKRTRWAVPVGLAAILLLGLGGYWQWDRTKAGRQRANERRMLAVLPFENLTGDASQDYFSDGLTEEMITQLGKLNAERLSVIARGSVIKYKGSSIALSQIGKELRADYLLQGSVRRAPGRVRITVHLIQVRDQTDLWAESYDDESKDILALEDSLARTVANQIHITLTAEQQRRLERARQVDAAAYEAYLKGRFYWNKRTADGLKIASTYFQQAINKDPAYGAAYSGLADCSSGLAWHGFGSPAEVLPKANAAALKAIEIDPRSAEAHASLALVLNHRLDWPGAEAEFKRALELDPRYANGHHWYGDYLSIKGRHDEALLEARKALELDPLNLMIGTWVGLRYYLARKYDRAIEQSRSTVELDPNFAAAHLVLGESYLQTGQHKQGLAELQMAAMLSGNSPLYLAQVGVAHAVAGQKTDALRITSRLQKISSERYVSPYGLAQIYAALNDKERTFQWLQAAYDERSVWMSYLAVDPAFDGVRSDPRFQDLLRGLALLP